MPDSNADYDTETGQNMNNTEQSETDTQQEFPPGLVLLLLFMAAMLLLMAYGAWIEAERMFPSPGVLP